MPASSSKLITGKKILVTGGTGTIGREVVKQLLEYEPLAIRVLSRNEHSQFQMSLDLASHRNLRFLIGDVRDKDRLLFAAEGIDVIFHAAALKHVAACDYNPFEAVKTNVIGTQNAIEAALANNAERFILISTDKAVAPASTMGATKLLAERLAVSAANYKGHHRTVFTVIRHGNILGSQGSAIPLFIKQIRDGGPITLRHKDMYRYFLSASHAVGATLEAASESVGGDVFVLKASLFRLSDLAEVLIEMLAPHFGHFPDSIECVFTGRLPGEKLNEELLSAYEQACAISKPLYYWIPPSASTALQHQPTESGGLISMAAEAAETKKSIKNILAESKLLEALSAKLDISPG